MPQDQPPNPPTAAGPPPGASTPSSGPVASAPVAPAHLEAATAVAQLLARYAELIDDGDFAGIGHLLGEARIITEDGTVVAEGSAAVEAMYTATTRRYPDGTPRTQHLITNLIVEPSAASAAPGASGPPGERGEIGEPTGIERVVARSSFTVLQATDGLGLQPIIAGRYRDVIERRPEGWVFVERAMIPRLFGDLGHHLLFDLQPAVPDDASS